MQQSDLVRSRAQHGSAQLTGSPLTSDPQFGALKDNGGPTQTMEPAAGSPVIDAGAAFGLTTDQRGLPRPAASARPCSRSEKTGTLRLSLSAAVRDPAGNARTVTKTVVPRRKK